MMIAPVAHRQPHSCMAASPAGMTRNESIRWLRIDRSALSTCVEKSIRPFTITTGSVGVLACWKGTGVCRLQVNGCNDACGLESCELNAENGEAASKAIISTRTVGEPPGVLQ